MRLLGNLTPLIPLSFQERGKKKREGATPPLKRPCSLPFITGKRFKRGGYAPSLLLNSSLPTGECVVTIAPSISSVRRQPSVAVLQTLAIVPNNRSHYQP